MQITSTTLRRIIKEELDAAMKEGVLDTADILGQYEKWIRSTMRSRGVSAEEAIMDFVILAIAGGDYHLDPGDEHDFDENAFRALLSANPAMVAALSDGETAAEDTAMNEDEAISEERDLKSLWTTEVVRNVTNIMRASGLHSGRPSTFLERHLEAADNLKAMMEEYNLSEEDLRAMMAYAKTLYSR